MAAAEGAVLPRIEDPTPIITAAIGALALIVVAFVGTMKNRPDPAPAAPAPGALTASDRMKLAVLEANVANVHGDQAADRRALDELTRRFNHHIEQCARAGGS